MTMPEKILLHVMVVGFHHKKGCQLEYCYPPIMENQPHDSPELPEVWKNLPNLALPDGAHNYDDDYVYFVLPKLDGSKEAVYGVSCYRQISAGELENRTPDITRGSVQKSVVVLSSLPLFGALRTRLYHITHAYFEGKDFSKVDLLADTYTSLTNCLTPNALESQLYCDLPVRELLMTYKHDLLIIFKLLLLERRVIMFHSPASELTSRMMALISLLPGVLKGGGLRHCCHVTPLRVTSLESFVDIRTSGPSPPASPEKAAPPAIATTDADSDMDVPLNLDSARLEIRSSAAGSGENSPSGRSGSPADAKDPAEETVDSAEAPSRRARAFRNLTSNVSAAGSFLRVKLASAATSASSAVTSVASRSRATFQTTNPIKEEGAGDLEKFDDPRTEVDDCGMPLPIFAESNLFLPYVSLHNLDVLENPSVRGFFIGANNMLYQQKRHLCDAFIGSSGSEMWMTDPELKRGLQLTSADLRFIDCLLNTVQATLQKPAPGSLEEQQQEDVFEGTDWGGSDEWLRLQFREYLLSMLKAAADMTGTPSGSNHGLSDLAGGEGDKTEEEKKEPEEEKEKMDEGEKNGTESLEQTSTEATTNGVATGAAAPLVGNPADFNSAYLKLLKESRHFKVWKANIGEYTGFSEVRSVHPSHGQFKLDDLQLRINHIFRHSEQGKRINSAVQNTGKIVQETGKAVGSAIGQARSAVTSLWSGFSKSAVSRFSRTPTAPSENEPVADTTEGAAPTEGEADADAAATAAANDSALVVS